MMYKIGYVGSKDRNFGFIKNYLYSLGEYRCNKPPCWNWNEITLCFGPTVASVFLYLHTLGFMLIFLHRIDRQRREDELKQRSSKKGQEMEQSLVNRVCLSFINNTHALELFSMRSCMWELTNCCFNAFVF